MHRISNKHKWWFSPDWALPGMLALAQEAILLQALKRAALTYNCRTATSVEALHSTSPPVSGLEADSNLQVQPQSWADSRLLSSGDKTEFCSGGRMGEKGSKGWKGRIFRFKTGFWLKDQWYRQLTVITALLSLCLCNLPYNAGHSAPNWHFTGQVCPVFLEFLDDSGTHILIPMWGLDPCSRASLQPFKQLDYSLRSCTLRSQGCFHLVVTQTGCLIALGAMCKISEGK